MPLAAGEQPSEDLFELLGGVPVGRREHFLHPAVDVGNDVQQVPAGRFQVLELGGEEPVAFLQCGEFLQRQRVDLAQGGQVAFGAPQPFFLLGPHIGNPLHQRVPVVVDRGAQCRPLIRSAAGVRRHGNRLVGAEVGQQVLGGHAQFLQGTGFECLDPQAVLRACKLIAVHRVGEPGQFRGRVGVGRADRGEFGVACGAGFLGAVPFPCSQGQGVLQMRQHGPGCGGDRVGAGLLGGTPAGAFSGGFAGPAFGLSGPFQGVGASGHRLELFLRRAQGEPGVRFRPAGRCGGERQGITPFRAGLFHRPLSAVRPLKPFDGGGQACLLLGNVGFGGGSQCRQPLGLLRGCAQGRTQCSQPFGGGGQAGVGVMQGIQGSIGAFPARPDPRSGGVQSCGSIRGPGPCCGEPGIGLFDGGGNFDPARGGHGTAAGAVGGEDVAVGRDRRGVRQGSHQVYGRLQVRHGHGTGQQGAQRLPHRCVGTEQ